mmetsp:Transcript_18133/g.48980  ORF Transcript_18133/g.48980 Transcript_18133/m.48980 type:complete len:263 (-) Transcript_18133:8-796(-)
MNVAVEPSSKVCRTLMPVSLGLPSCFFSSAGVNLACSSSSRTFHMFTIAVTAAGTTITPTAAGSPGRGALLPGAVSGGGTEVDGLLLPLRPGGAAALGGARLRRSSSSSIAALLRFLKPSRICDTIGKAGIDCDSKIDLRERSRFSRLTMTLVFSRSSLMKGLARCITVSRFTPPSASTAAAAAPSSSSAAAGSGFSIRGSSSSAANASLASTSCLALVASASARSASSSSSITIASSAAFPSSAICSSLTVSGSGRGAYCA